MVSPPGLVVIAVGCSAVAIGTLVVMGGTVGSPILVGSFALAFLVAQVIPIQIRRGQHAEIIGFEEAIMVPALLTLEPATAMAALLLSLPFWQLAVRQPLSRLIFNQGQLVVSFGTAQLVLVALVGPAPGVTGISTIAVVVAIACMFAVNQLLVTSMLALRSGRPMRYFLREDAATKCALLAGNVSMGLILSPSLDKMPELLPAGLIFVVLVHGAVRGYMRAGQGDRAFTTLVASAAQLGNDLPVERISAQLAEVAQGIVGGCGAAVRLDQDELATLGDGYELREEELRVQVGRTGRLFAVVRLEASGCRIGELRVWRDAGDASRSRAHRRNDLAALEIVARQGAFSIAKAVIERRSREHLAMIAQVFEHAHECLVLLDALGRVTAWNPATAELVGLDDRRMLGSPIGAVSPAIAAAIDNGTGGRVEASISTASGERRVVQASIAAVRARGDEGPITGWVIAMHDVTRAHEAERLKSDFVATVSHELRTPLTTINGFLETLRRDDLDLDPEQVSTFLDIMRGEAGRLERLISDLLDTSAIEAGRPPSMRPCTFDLADEVRRAVLAFRTAHPDVTVMFCEPDASIARTVTGDPDRLQQVLANLLQNARRHGDPLRGVEVELLDPTADGHGVCVRDHGPGVPVDEQERIFDRFYFTANSVTRMGGGAGLGLYICRRLMEAMSGSITLHSVPGNGASFLVRLPAAAPRRHRRRVPSMQRRSLPHAHS